MYLRFSSRYHIAHAWGTRTCTYVYDHRVWMREKKRHFFGKKRKAMPTLYIFVCIHVQLTSCCWRFELRSYLWTTPNVRVTSERLADSPTGQRMNQLPLRSSFIILESYFWFECVHWNTFATTMIYSRTNYVQLTGSIASSQAFRLEPTSSIRSSSHLYPLTKAPFNTTVDYSRRWW